MRGENLLLVEETCIAREGTLYPYGLNDRYNNTNITMSLGSLCVYKLMRFSRPCLNRNKARRRLHSRNVSNPFQGFVSLPDLIRKWEKVLYSSVRAINFIKNEINFLTKQKLKVLLKKISMDRGCTKHLQDLVVDFCKFKLNLNSWMPEENTKIKAFIIIPFESKAQDFLNLRSVLRNDEAKNKIPHQRRVSQIVL